MTVDEGQAISRLTSTASMDALEVHEASTVLVEDAWLPRDIHWTEAATDPTSSPHKYGLGWTPTRSVDIYEGYDPREPFID